MNKKIIAVIGLVVLLSLTVFVLAANRVAEVGPIAIEKGWNLIYGFANPEQLEGQTLESSHIKAIYAFIPTTQEYARVFPDPEISKLGLIDDDELLNTAFWVYSDKQAQPEYWLETEPTPLNERPIYKGWNFVGITPDVIDMLLDKKFGSCDIEKGYFWDMFNKKWIKFPFSNPQQFTWDGDNIDGYGLVIKVSSDCTLGSSTTNPPGLPGDRDDTGFLIEKDISPFTFRERNERAYWKEDCTFTNKGEECEYYRAIYDYSEEGLDVIEVQIEVPSTTWDISEDTLTEIEGQLDGNVYSDDAYWNGNFYWFSQSTKENENTMDRFLSWESDNKLIMITIDDYDSEKFDWGLMEGFIDTHFNKYPSSIQS